MYLIGYNRFMIVTMNNFSQDFICRIQNKINNYLQEKYCNTNIIQYNPEQKDYFIHQLDQKLTDENDWRNGLFILPNNKIKKLTFDLSGLDLSIIDNNNLLKSIKIEHKNVIYKGFNLDDIISSGCVRIGYIKEQSEFYVFLSENTKPPKKLFDILEEILFQVNNIYIEIKDYKTYYFSNSNGDSIQNIKNKLLTRK